MHADWLFGVLLVLSLGDEDVQRWHCRHDDELKAGCSYLLLGARCYCS